MVQTIYDIAKSSWRCFDSYLDKSRDRRRRK